MNTITSCDEFQSGLHPSQDTASARAGHETRPEVGAPHHVRALVCPAFSLNR